jgi:hypothetical protein
MSILICSILVHSPTICRVEPHPSVGPGTVCRLESKSITGFALAHADQIQHLSAFSRNEMGNREKSFTLSNIVSIYIHL